MVSTQVKRLKPVRQFRNKEIKIMTLMEKVESALEKVRPSLQADGGDVQLVDVDQDGLVKVKLMGACQGCPMSQMTLKMGIEKILKQNIPEVTSVESV
jgi:Fe-S cluster biogenesis protein NfuA